MENVDFTKSYVLNDVEVKLTGRVAEKSIPAVGRNKEPRITYLYEITPTDLEVGSWKKWVRMIDLYEIKAK
ncbi:MAG: hypothetical protein KGI25_02970 [Thaumarchaeota archaeon]|nr:hypothetical protein [Nitrososphaerota archaeon]